MKWSEAIELREPLRRVVCLADVPGQEWATFLGQREQEAYARGQREGEKALSEQMVQQRAELANMQQGILESLRTAVPQVVRETEAALIALALAAAQKLVAGLPINVEMVEAVVREALQQVEDASNVMIQLHPEDLLLLRQNHSPLLGDASDSGPLRFVTSSDVTRGGCRIETRFGVLDARRETKLKQLNQGLGL